MHAITLIMYVNIDKVYAMANKINYNNYPRIILPKYYKNLLILQTTIFDYFNDLLNYRSMNL